MLKANLSTERHSRLRIPWGVVLLSLVALAIWQSYTAWQLRVERESAAAEIATRRDLLATLEDEHLRLSHIDFAKEAAAVQARNEWENARRLSPIRLLAALETRLPEGAELRSFQASLGTGELLAVGQDLDTITRWFNTVFTGQGGKLTVESRDGARLLCRYTWAMP